MTPEQIKALQVMCDVILTAVEAGGTLGAPSGILYAAFMSSGCTLSMYEDIMRGLCRAGMVTLRAHCYHLTQAGKQRVDSLRASVSSSTPEAKC